jgi:hypothetical protein
MTETIAPRVPAATAHQGCSPARRITRSLLGYGVLAGPFYICVSLAQALTRGGFDLSRHEWSLLANGPGGWVQVLNLVLTGLMVVAAATGFRRSLRDGRDGRDGRAARWAPRLLAVYGVSLVAAGAFRCRLPRPCRGHLAAGLAVQARRTAQARRGHAGDGSPVPGVVRRDRVRGHLARREPGLHGGRRPHLGLAQPD